MSYKNIDGKLLGYYFANIMYNSKNNYCATLTNVGYVILRLLGHGFLPLTNIKEFFQSLFYFLIMKGDSTIEREISSNMSKRLFTFFIRYFIDIKIDIVDKFFEYYTLKEETLKILIDGLGDLVILNLLLVEKNDQGAFSKYNESFILFIKKWIMQSLEDIKKRGAFFKLFVFMLIEVLNINNENSDLKYLSSFIKKELNYNINKWRKDLYLQDKKNMEKFKEINFINYVHFISTTKLMRKDWILDLIEFVNDFSQEDLIYYTQPYKIFSKFKTTKKDLESFVEDDKDEDYVTLSNSEEDSF